MLKRLGVSNIAWPEEWAADAYQVLRDEGVSKLEVAPGKLLSGLDHVKPGEAARKRDQVLASGLEIVSAQSLLFGHPELEVFVDPDRQCLTLQWLEHVIAVCSELGCRKLVFGSPKNRLKRELSWTQALPKAVEFFKRLAALAQTKRVEIVFEANSKFYGCDFGTSLEEAAALVEGVAEPGLRLHVDTGNMVLENEFSRETLARFLPSASHFHLSAPRLADVSTLRDLFTPILEREKLHDFLSHSGYHGHVVIEMLPTTNQKDAVLTQLRECVRWASSL